MSGGPRRAHGSQFASKRGDVSSYPELVSGWQSSDCWGPCLVDAWPLLAPVPGAVHRTPGPMLLLGHLVSRVIETLLVAVRRGRPPSDR